MKNPYKQSSLNQNNLLKIKRLSLVAGEIEIPNHSIDYLFELEAFIKTHSRLLICSR